MRWPHLSVVVLAVSIFAVPSPADDRPTRPPSDGDYRISTLAAGSKAVVLRYLVQKGTAWVSTGGKWQLVTESEPPPPGVYEVTLVAMELGYTAVRLERVSGQTWTLRNQRWERVEEPDPAPTEDRPK